MTNAEFNKKGFYKFRSKMKVGIYSEYTDDPIQQDRIYRLSNNTPTGLKEKLGFAPNYFEVRRRSMMFGKITGKDKFGFIYLNVKF